MLTPVSLVSSADQLLDDAAVQTALERSLSGAYRGARLLILIPDHTRTLPLALLFRLLVNILHDTARLDFMVALGTHPPLSDEALCALVGITSAERVSTYRHIGLLNHAWDDPSALRQLGVISREQVQQLAGAGWHPSLGGDVPVRINRHIFEYDQVLIVGPVFPHEVVGFSGGAKYLFPGISGREMIDVTHWLGALTTVRDTIGVQDTPMRRMIELAAAMVTVPVSLIALTVEHEGLSGLFAGDLYDAWRAAAAHSAERHIIWLDRPLQRVLSIAPPMYDELWVAAKAMYKLDPAVADGGEIVVLAPHLGVVSAVHGRYLDQIGYHVRDYFLAQWERFSGIPLGVIAHSTHFKGAGHYANGVEEPRIRVTLASQISAEACGRLNLPYADPARIAVEEWLGREDEGVLVVPKAGEMLYRVREAS